MQSVTVAGQWFSMGTPVSSTNKTNHHDITEILLKVALNTITLILFLNQFCNVIIDRSRCLEWVTSRYTSTNYEWNGDEKKEV